VAAQAAAPDELAHSLALMVAGELAAARAGFERLAERRGVSIVVETAALLGRAACYAFACDPAAPVAVEEALAAAKLVAMPAMDRLAQSIALLTPVGSEGPAEHLLDECRRAEDRWGEAAVLLFNGLGQASTGKGDGVALRAAEAACAELGAGALAAWAAATAIVADLQAGRSPTPAQVRAAERAGSRTGPLPYATALLAVSEVEEDARARGHALRLATVLAERAGVGGWLRRLAATLDSGEPAPVAPAAEAGPKAAEVPAVKAPAQGTAKASKAVAAGATGAPRVAVRCLGGFEVAIDGAPVDLVAVRPQNQALLRILCMHANRPVHRERLLEWLWPDRDPEQGGHSLQVAVSALRRVLEPDAPRGRWSILKREGSSYRLALRADGDADVRVVETHVAAARAADRRGDAAAAATHDRKATDAYTGDLLPADGPAEWVADDRDRLRRSVAESYERLAVAATTGDDHDGAAVLAERGLELDPDRDSLWQRRIAALRAAGNHIAARAAEQRYEALLAELGVQATG
jgi:DNA-binding SARP family transcriptional activator